MEIPFNGSSPKIDTSNPKTCSKKPGRDFLKRKKEASDQQAAFFLF